MRFNIPHKSRGRLITTDTIQSRAIDERNGAAFLRSTADKDRFLLSSSLFYAASISACGKLADLISVPRAKITGNEAYAA